MWVTLFPIIQFSASMLLLYLLIIFVIALWREDNGIIDIAYGFGFVGVTIAIFSLWEATNFQQKIITSLILVWGLRLATRIFLKNWGKPEDFRYRAWREAIVLSPDQSRTVVSSMDGAVYCLNTSDGTLLWKFENGLGNYASPYIEGDRVYVASLDKHLYALDLETGEKRWDFAMRARIFASPRIYGGKLYCGCNDARLYELDPKTGKETGYFQVTERITNPLARDERTDLFYLVTFANEVYCLKRKNRKLLSASCSE